MGTLGARIKVLRGNESQESFASKIEISKGSLGRYERDENSPSADVLLKICSKADISVEWLLTGSGSMKTGTAIPTEPAPSSQSFLKERDSEFVAVPMVEARLSAGGGSFETSGLLERCYSFRRNFLHRLGQPSQMVLMRVDGDSMEPELQDGDIVLLDQSQSAPRPGKIYAVGVEDMVYLKQIDKAPGKLILRSLNPVYTPLEVEITEQLEQTVRIIGRAIWWCREA